jgi:hypothetical protein
MGRPRSGTERTPCCRRAHRPQRADNATSRIGHEFGHTGLRIARRHEPRPALARAGPAGRGARPARAPLRLVHRGLRHRQPERSQGAARRVDVSQPSVHPSARPSASERVRARPSASSASRTSIRASSHSKSGQSQLLSRRRSLLASIVRHASSVRPAESRRRAISAAIFGTFLASSLYCSIKKSTSPRASAISVSAKRTVLTRERSATSSAYIGPEDDQPIFTRSFSAGFVTGRFGRAADCRVALPPASPR